MRRQGKGGRQRTQHKKSFSRTGNLYRSPIYSLFFYVKKKENEELSVQFPHRPRILALLRVPFLLVPSFRVCACAHLCVCVVTFAIRFHYFAFLSPFVFF